jgi:hypothetical protein
MDWTLKLIEWTGTATPSSEQWSDISSTMVLCEDFIRAYKENVDWFYVSRVQKLSESFIEEFQDRVDWRMIEAFQDVSPLFLERVKRDIKPRSQSSMQLLPTENVYTKRYTITDLQWLRQLSPDALLDIMSLMAPWDAFNFFLTNDTLLHAGIAPLYKHILNHSMFRHGTPAALACPPCSYSDLDLVSVGNRLWCYNHVLLPLFNEQITEYIENRPDMDPLASKWTQKTYAKRSKILKPQYNSKLIMRNVRHGLSEYRRRETPFDLMFSMRAFSLGLLSNEGINASENTQKLKATQGLMNFPADAEVLLERFQTNPSQTLKIIGDDAFNFVKEHQAQFLRIRHVGHVTFPEGSFSSLFLGFQQAHENIKVKSDSKVNYMVKIKTDHLDPPHRVQVTLKDSLTSESVYIPSLRLQFVEKTSLADVGIDILEYASKRRIGRIDKTGKAWLDGQYNYLGVFLNLYDKYPLEFSSFLGRLTSFCVYCGAQLEDAASKERGYGPTCARQHSAHLVNYTKIMNVDGSAVDTQTGFKHMKIHRQTVVQVGKRKRVYNDNLQGISCDETYRIMTRDNQILPVRGDVLRDLLSDIFQDVMMEEDLDRDRPFPVMFTGATMKAITTWIDWKCIQVESSSWMRTFCECFVPSCELFVEVSKAADFFGLVLLKEMNTVLCQDVLSGRSRQWLQDHITPEMSDDDKNLVLRLTTFAF